MFVATIIAILDYPAPSPNHPNQTPKPNPDPDLNPILSSPVKLRTPDKMGPFDNNVLTLLVEHEVWVLNMSSHAKPVRLLQRVATPSSVS